MIETVTGAFQKLQMYGAIPLICLTACLILFNLRAPQLRQFIPGLRSLPESDETSLGVILGGAGMLGAATFVGIGSALSLGGAGVLFWVWLFAFLIAGLFSVETWLSRTDVPGESRMDETGSLPRRLMLDSGPRRVLGFALALSLVVAGFAFVGASQASALLDSLGSFLDVSDRNVLLAALAGAGLLAVFGRQGAQWVGWLAFAALVLVVGVCLWLIALHPSESFSTLTRAASQGLDGAPSAPPFVGAAVGEVATLSIVFILVHLGAPLGIIGSLQRTKAGTRKQAASATMISFLFALVTTLVCMACVGTDAFRTPVESTRNLTELTFLKIGFETASQREETDRRHTGYVRIRKGMSMEHEMVLATMQGSIEEPRFDYYGKSADLAFSTKDGKVTRMMRVHRRGNLMDLPIEQVAHVTVRGTMLPTGAGLLKSATWLGTGSSAAALMLGLAMVLLGLLALVVWGWGLHDALPASWPNAALKLASALPALGAISAIWFSDDLLLVGGWAVGISMILASLALAWLSKEVSLLDTSK